MVLLILARIWRCGLRFIYVLTVEKFCIRGTIFRGGKLLSFPWLRSGYIYNPDGSRCLSSSGDRHYAYTGADLAVRPALHLRFNG